MGDWASSSSAVYRETFLHSDQPFKGESQCRVGEGKSSRTQRLLLQKTNLKITLTQVFMNGRMADQPMYKSQLVENVFIGMVD